jgi:hypothetical protein
LPKRRRFMPYVDDYIENFSPSHKNQFSLRMLYLVMQPSKHPSFGTGAVVLYECLFDPKFPITTLLIAFQKESAIIAENVGLDQQDSGQGNLSRFH